MKRKLCLALAALMLLTSIGTVNVAAEPSEDSAKETAAPKIVGSADSSYDEYLEAAADYSNAVDDIVIDATSFVSSSGAKLEKLETLEGHKGVIKWTNEAGKAVYEFEVPETGFYTVKFKYRALPKRNNPISIGLKFDGKILFDGMADFNLPRLFVDDGDVRVDGIGNEFAPAQKEEFVFQEGYFKDSTGLEPNPYKIALTAGKHTVEISSVAEPFALDDIILEAPVEYEDYNTVSENYDKSEYATIKEPIKLEGESAVYKSSYSLVAQYDQTDPSVSSKNGSDPYKTRINYIGNTNWSTPGDKLTWKFNVPESGYYKLGFRYKQNLVLNGTSYRKLTIDGVQPFSEAANIGFDYGIKWDYMEFADDNGNPYLVYLKEGPHELSLEVALGELAVPVRELKDLMYQVGALYRQIVMITGESPDNNRDYALFDQIPNFLERLEEYSSELNRLAGDIEKLAGQTGGTNATTIRTLSEVMDNMIKHKFTAHQYLSMYYTNYTSVSALVYSMMEMGVNLDYIEIAAPEYNFVNPEASWWEKTSFGIERFFASFSANYNNISSNVETEESITIWANWGRDQIRVLNNLLESSFTKETGIGVNLKMSNATYVQAILSGRGPDCSLHMARSEPVNLALRGAVIDLKQFDYYDPETRKFTEEYTGDFTNTLSRFLPENANTKMNPVLPYTFKNGDKEGVYALPDTLGFNMMFYRTDIFEEYGLQVPKTWDDYIEVASILYRNNLQASLPYTQITTVAQVNAGVGSLSLLPTFLMQMGGQLYNDELSGTDLTSATSIKAFEYWTDFYTEYKFPVTADFFNRFRLGIMPMGIQNYSQYINLSMAAPEITGKWKMAPIPGFVDENGKINNVQAGSGTGCGILKVSKNPQLGWEFLKWWTSAETQLNYSNNCESILGVSGRVATANVEAFTKMGWDNESVNNLLAQWSMMQEVPEIPGSYYVSRCIDQAYWNVVNNSQNAKDMLIKWAEIADTEIQRKREQYNVQ